MEVASHKPDEVESPEILPNLPSSKPRTSNIEILPLGSISRENSIEVETTGSSTDPNEFSSQHSEDNDTKITTESLEAEEPELVWDPKVMWIKPVRQLPGPAEHPLFIEMRRKENIVDSEKPYTPVHPNLPSPSLRLVEEGEEDMSVVSEIDFEYETEPELKTEKSASASGCAYGYARRLYKDPSSDQFILGEIWRSHSGQTTTRWRRHQWIVD